MPVILDMPGSDYYPYPAINNSLLKYCGPKNVPVDAYNRCWLNPNYDSEVEDSTSKRQGRALHMFMLEPEQFNQTYTMEPKLKVGLTEKQPFAIGTNGDGNLWDEMQRLRDAILGDPLMSAALEGSQREVTMIVDLPCGLKGKCRHDSYKPQFSTDLKFMEEVSIEAVAWAIVNYGYDRQAHWYLDLMQKATGVEHQNFITAFIEKPKKGMIPKILPVQFHSNVLEAAALANEQALNRFADWHAQYGTTTPWPGYESKVYTVYRPGEGGLRGIELPNAYNYKQ